MPREAMAHKNKSTSANSCLHPASTAAMKNSYVTLDDW